MRRRYRAAGACLPHGVVLLVVCALLPGCALYPPLEIAQFAGKSGTQMVSSVPHFPQTAHQCGPAALASVLRASGVDTDPERLSAQVYLPGREGSLQVELMSATRRAGRIPFPLGREPRALIAELEAGWPVLVMQNLLTPHVPAWHYAVVTGFDTRRNRFQLSSGEAIWARTFLRTWDWAGRWAMVALPPGMLPANADRESVFEALAAYERVAARADSSLAWQAASARWPDDPLPYLALGTLSYTAADLRTAIRLYRRGLAVDAQNPALANNLASVLGEAGCARAGETVLQPVLQALGDDSRWKPVMSATLAELATRRGGEETACHSLAE